MKYFSVYGRACCRTDRQSDLWSEHHREGISLNVVDSRQEIGSLSTSKLRIVKQRNIT